MLRKKEHISNFDKISIKKGPFILNHKFLLHLMIDIDHQ